MFVIWRSTLEEVGGNLKAEDPTLRLTARAVFECYDDLESAEDFDYEVAAPLWNAYHEAKDRG